MYIVDSYNVAILMCVITMICWGSHANMLKMQSKGYSYSYYYWDQAIGYILLPLILALTMGSIGQEGQAFIPNLLEADASSWLWAIGAAFVFNLANIIFVASVDIAGMAVAFPVGMGFSLVLGVILNYIAKPEGDPILIFAGMLCVVIAIVINARAYAKMNTKEEDKVMVKKGIKLAIIGGFLMGLFYYLLQNSMPTVLNAESLSSITGTGKFTPYSAVVVFAGASFLSNFIYNTYVMRHPFKGEPVTYKGYFKQSAKDHIIGITGGMINATGTTFNIIASGMVGAAVAYALGQSNPMIAAIWGVFVWKEFRGAPKGTNKLIALMFLFFAAGVVLLTLSK
ncbi:multidrug DMT transporter permease [Parabacteroides sp. OttesenSCG-928-G07]|nr:multidrug DMT transporter permease [Parabacteroides sp. OttesenSCG-928-G21]MDL2278434.1 multidrug DMT transporter permease [Parabacteroides sp. OttesenSCG-928-G07]